jgi:hypothetical protein
MEITFELGNTFIEFTNEILEGVQQSATGLIVFHGFHSAALENSAALRLDEIIKESDTCYITGLTNEGAMISGMKVVTKYTCSVRKDGQSKIVKFYGMAVPT